MNSVGQHYRVEQGDPLTDKERVFGLWRQVNFDLFGSEAHAKLRYEWFYKQNPQGPARVYFLIDDHRNEVVGAVGAGTRLFAAADGQVVRASLLVDFIVSPAHRSLFPALLLQRKAREAEALLTDMIYGLPDIKAIPIFKRLGSDRLLESYRYSRVLRVSRFAARYVPRYVAALLGVLADSFRAGLLSMAVSLQDMRTSWADAFDDRCDQLWEGMEKSASLGWGERSSQFLQWRFNKGPQEGGRHTLFVSTNRGREQCAYFVCIQTGSEMIVPDFLLTGDVTAMTGQLRALTLAAWKNRAEVIRLDFAGRTEVLSALKAAGYIRRGEARPCFLMFGKSMVASAYPQSWCFTRADEDVY